MNQKISDMIELEEKLHQNVELIRSLQDCKWSEFKATIKGLASQLESGSFTFVGTPTLLKQAQAQWDAWESYGLCLGRASEQLRRQRRIREIEEGTFVPDVVRYDCNSKE